MQDESTIPDDLVAMLDLLAQTIVQALGFGVAVVNLARPDGVYEVVSVWGDEDAREALMGLRDSAETWDRMLAGSEAWGKLRFIDHRDVDGTDDVYSWIPDVAPLELENAWHPEDALFAPLNAEDGSRLGILSVDLPLDGRRPNAATCSALEAFAVSAALAIEHATMRQRAEASEIAFKQQATHDPLTGIANRSLLEDRLRHAVTARPENAAVMALVFVDLDKFKAINDVHSHAVGDHVLRTVANRITAVVRPHDTAARWGGDEFLILLDQLPDERTAIDIVERISSAIAQPTPYLGQDFSVTASMGVSMWPTSQPHLDADELIRRADAAMYEVKHTGRNGYAVFHPSGEATSRRMHLLDLLSRAVTQERIVLHYQPIVQLLDERVVGVEALLRLRDDDGSLVYPLDFLDLAASTGMLLPIEHEVIQQACGQVARWGRDGHDLRLSVNVCVEQVSRINDFERTVRKALADSGLLAEQLVCELTEHALLSLSDPTLEGISRLVESGVRFSIDDFGTGYGSLTYVHAMPIHELKIDRSFVSASPQGTTGAILRSIASLAADLGMDCVAEGVETSGQQKMVREAGIHHAQGYLYAKPLEPDVLQQLLRERRTAAGR